jgi:glutamate dehydrogenase
MGEAVSGSSFNVRDSLADLAAPFSMDQKYLDKSSPLNAYRLETYRAAGSVSAKSTQQLRCYFLSKCQFMQPVPTPDSAEWGDISKVSDKTFLGKASENTLQIYQEVMEEVLKRSGPVIGECHLSVA